MDELEKTPVTEVTTGEKSSQETLNITMTPDDICMSSIKSRLYKDFEYEQQPNDKETELFSSLNYNLSKFISPQEQKSIVTSLKKLSSSLLTCQKLYSSVVHQSEKKVERMFEK